MKINTIIFDYDGTIANTNELIIKSWQHTYQHFTNKDGCQEDIIATFGEPLVTSMEKAFPKENPDKCVEIYREYQMEHFNGEVKVFEGIVEVIKELKNRGYKIAVATSRGRGSTLEGLEKFRILECMDAVVTAHDCTKHKPDPEPLLITLEKLKSKSEETIMIGDSIFDIKCAQNAGVKSVLVEWAVATKVENLKKEDKPDFVIAKPMDLLDLI